MTGGLNPYDALKTGKGSYTLKSLKSSQLKVGREGKTNYSFRNTDNSTGEEKENGESRCCITEYGAALLQSEFLLTFSSSRSMLVTALTVLKGCFREAKLHGEN